MATFRGKVLEHFKGYDPTVQELLMHKTAYSLRGAHEDSSWRLAAMSVLKNHNGELPVRAIGRFFDEKSAKSPYWKKAGHTVFDAFEDYLYESYQQQPTPSDNQIEKETN